MPPRIIACSNIKGGEGKTTLARHLAHFAEERGLRTLAIDLDPQGDLSASLTPLAMEVDEDEASNSAELFIADFDVANVKLINVSDRLALLHSTDDLDEVTELDERSSALVKRARDNIRALAKDFDVVIVDTPTNAATCYKTGMAAAHVTVSPLQLDTYGMRGAQKFIRKLNQVKSTFNPTVKHLGFVVNRYNSRAKSHAQMVEELREAGFNLFPTILRERAAVQDALDRQMPVWSGPRGTVNRTAAKEFRNMCAEVYLGAGVALPVSA
ncbi:ParA family protein [Dyella ginsengisoli]|uniref:ParA family protein n=1 Tax=Dyella ginsengisoli TaxID=363848 RepID=UPI000344DB43|nr:ParA family protein [Dyella ginsengisoli]